jgi:hypothetical protein
LSCGKCSSLYASRTEPKQSHVVLRHELGHSIIDVGEEYDGIGIDGFFGINAARSASNITWKHWLTTTKHNNDVHDHPLSKNSAAKSPRVERSAMPLQEYAWTILNTTSAWTHPFHSQGNFSRYLVKFSLAGIPSGRDMSVQLDGHDLGWVPRADIGVDRWHYNIYVNHSLSKGEHEVKFQLKNAELEQPQLCSVEVLEYGSEKEYVLLFDIAASPAKQLPDSTAKRASTAHSRHTQTTTSESFGRCEGRD